jgi:hypothetical protein
MNTTVALVAVLSFAGVLFVYGHGIAAAFSDMIHAK